MRILISLAALLLSVILLQLSSGGLGPLDALSGFELNFTTAQIGLLGSAHFVGFFIGCWWAPRLLGTVGHSRAFAAFAATGAIGLLAHMLIIDPTAWAVMRIATGLCVAGCYTVIEAWLQAHGFEREGCWEGKRLALIREGKQIVAPYLDGNCRNAEINEFANCLEINEDGELECDNVGGFASLPHEIHCESCEEGVDEDETCTTHAGY